MKIFHLGFKQEESLCNVADKCFSLFSVLSLILKKAYYGLMGLVCLDVMSATYEYLC